MQPTNFLSALAFALATSRFVVALPAPAGTTTDATTSNNTTTTTTTTTASVLSAVSSTLSSATASATVSLAASSTVASSAVPSIASSTIPNIPSSTVPSTVSSSTVAPTSSASANSTRSEGIMSVMAIPAKYGCQCEGFVMINEDGTGYGKMRCSYLPPGIRVSGNWNLVGFTNWIYPDQLNQWFTTKTVPATWTRPGDLELWYDTQADGNDGHGSGDCSTWLEKKRSGISGMWLMKFKPVLKCNWVAYPARARGVLKVNAFSDDHTDYVTATNDYTEKTTDYKLTDDQIEKNNDWWTEWTLED